MKKNVEINLDQQENVHVAELNWGEDIRDEVPVEQTGLVLAADCVYFEVRLLLQ